MKSENYEIAYAVELPVVFPDGGAFKSSLFKHGVDLFSKPSLRKGNIQHFIQELPPLRPEVSSDSGTGCFPVP